VAHSLLNLSGMVAVVTGGGGHIGGASARALAEAGADVAVVDIRREPAEQVAAQVLDLGRRAMSVVGDASDYDAVGAMTESIIVKLGQIDILVNVAGGSEPRPFLELAPEDYERCFRANMLSAWSWSHRVAPRMIGRKHQRIINIASISGKHGGGPPATVSKSAYASAKAGVIGLTKGLAKELSPDITVNCVCPGLIQTVGTSRITEGPNRDQILATIPKGRFGEPTDVAAAVLFFASNGADWITGETMDVNGGQYID
jgi:NAD(P)-dependent dehydrogenase (short-subunit alcohol dehydrogenase family)